MNETTNQDGDKKQFPNINPEGKGGFGDHPEHRSDGRWSKDNSFTYWMNYFKSLAITDFLTWEKDNPPENRSVASDLAYSRVMKARSDLKNFQEVANRTEGMPKQTMIMGADETVSKISIEVVSNGTEVKDN